MLALLHESRMGSEITKAGARHALYWPSTSTDVEETVANCATCLQHRNAQSEKLVGPHAIPEIACQRVSADIFTHQGKDYLLLVDYYQRLTLLRRDTQANRVIGATAAHQTGTCHSACQGSGTNVYST